MNYLEKLKQSAKENNSIVCMGLDPVVEAMPEVFSKQGISGFILYLEHIFEEMKQQKVIPAAFKPNQGFYLKHDKLRKAVSGNLLGTVTLSTVMNIIEQKFPGIPIIIDYKKGDIEKSSANYAVEGFEEWEADAVTVAPYMGIDSIMPFAKYCNDEQGKGVYILNRTSNPGASDIQNLKTIPDTKSLYNIITETVASELTSDKASQLIKKVIEKQITPLYMVVADKIIEWSKENPGVGAVVGATSLEELSDLAKIYAGKAIPLLIPGVGGQGGKADEVVDRLKDAGYDLSLARINSSSGLTHPWAKKKEKAPEDYAKICVEELYKLNEAINFKP